MTEKNPPNNNRKSNGGGRRPRRRKPQEDDKFEWRRASRTLILWILIVIGSWILFSKLNLGQESERLVSFTQYRRYVELDQIASAEIIDREFHGKLKNDEGSIKTTLPLIDRNMLAEWDSLGIDYNFKEKTTSWLGVLISFLPWIFIIAIWIYILRRMQGGGGTKGVFSFGKSRAKLMVESKARITFADVAGCDEAKEELQEVIAFLREPKKFSRLGGRIPKGALLLGPPGTGKTLLARAVAGEAEVPFFSMSGADFVEMFVGVGAARVRDLFEQGKKNAPCIIFIDEIDAVGRHRGAGLGGGHDEREQTLNQLLVEMDGFESNDGVILLAATNRPDVLDPALTRPGRFDRQIVVDRPDVRGREGILKVHARKIPLAPDVRLDVLAKSTPGLAGAELANLVNEAALLAARRNAKDVTMNDFEEAKDKVMMGTERKSMLIPEDEKRQTAFHEAGHVLVAKLTPGSDPVHKVTIIPRGRALGLTHYLPLDEKHNYSRSYLNQTLVHLMGGRAAEKIVFKELSTGAGNDIQRATEIARRMVCEWGMSDRLGPVSLGNKNEEVFLGRDFAQQRNYSERTAQQVDDEIRRIVSNAEQKSEKIIRDNLPKLNLLADALLEREILDSEEINTILDGGKLPPALPKFVEAVITKSDRTERTEASSGSQSPRQQQPQQTKQHHHTQHHPQQQQQQQQQTKPQQPQRNSGASGSSEKKETTETSTSPSESRRELARRFGVASSRDPRNQRPSMKELAREEEREQSQTKPPTKAIPEKTSVEEVEKKDAGAEESKQETKPTTVRKTQRRYSRTRKTTASRTRKTDKGAEKEEKTSRTEADKPPEAKNGG